MLEKLPADLGAAIATEPMWLQVWVGSTVSMVTYASWALRILLSRVRFTPGCSIVEN